MEGPVLELTERSPATDVGLSEQAVGIQRDQEMKNDHTDDRIIELRIEMENIMKSGCREMTLEDMSSSVYTIVARRNAAIVIEHFQKYLEIYLQKVSLQRVLEGGEILQSLETIYQEYAKRWPTMAEALRYVEMYIKDETEAHGTTFRTTIRTTIQNYHFLLKLNMQHHVRQGCETTG